jgi:histidine triad (HIT) family protein
MHLFLRLARAPFARFLIGWLFAHMSFIIPVNRIRETETLIAFHHPKPSATLHVLLVPKRRLAGLEEIGPDDLRFLTDLFEAVRSLVDEYDLASAGYRLISNGGRYQEVPQLHFHLISGETRFPER